MRSGAQIYLQTKINIIKHKDTKDRVGVRGNLDLQNLSISKVKILPSRQSSNTNVMSITSKIPENVTVGSSDPIYGDFSTPPLHSIWFTLLILYCMCAKSLIP